MPAAAAGALVAVGLLLLMMLVVVEARPAEATFPGKPGKIVYSGRDAPNGDYEIYTINPGGEGKVKQSYRQQYGRLYAFLEEQFVDQNQPNRR